MSSPLGRDPAVMESGLNWLHLLSPTQRRVLLGGTLTGLAISSLFVTWLPLTAFQMDLLVVWLVVVGAAGWAVMFHRYGRPAIQQMKKSWNADEERRHRDRGLLFGTKRQRGVDALRSADPGFSLPAFLRFVQVFHRRMAGDDPRALALFIGSPPEDRAFDAFGLPHPVAVVRSRAGLRVRMATPVRRAEEIAWIETEWTFRVEGTTSKPEDLEALSSDCRWRCTGWSRRSGPVPRTAITPSPTLGADRRALAAREESFDLMSIESLVEQILEELRACHDRGDYGGVAPWLTEGALEDLALSPIPRPSEQPVRWIDVEEGGWFVRATLAVPGLAIDVMRKSDVPDASWQVWRLRTWEAST